MNPFRKNNSLFQLSEGSFIPFKNRSFFVENVLQMENSPGNT